MPGVSTDSIVSPGSASARRRAVISISGSSGTAFTLACGGVDPWIEQAAAEIARRAPRELEALVAVSSPSGDVHGANECASVCAALAPDEAAIERVPCSSPGHAEDLVARLHGTGTRKVLLVGHIDTVVAHAEHKPLDARRASSSSAPARVDMKGGDDARARRAARVRQAPRALRRARAAARLRRGVADAPTSATCERFAGFDACLCFEAGELAGGDEGVVVRRKAAGTIHVDGHGRSAHSGSAPDRGRNALLALAAAAQAVAAQPRPARPGAPDRRPDRPALAATRSTSCPAAGELFCDVRADDLDAIEARARPTSRPRSAARAWRPS